MKYGEGKECEGKTGPEFSDNIDENRKTIRKFKRNDLKFTRNFRTNADETHEIMEGFKRNRLNLRIRR